MADTPTSPTPDPTDAGALTIADWERLSRGSLGERLGIRLTEVGAERAVGTMPVEGNTQPYGLLHGGASAALAETLGSVAAAVQAGPGRIAVGIELNASHHASTRAGTVTGVATALTLGRTLAAYEIVVTEDATGRRLCTARLTALLRDAPPAR